MPNINLGWNFLKLFFLCSWDRNITVHTVFDIYYRIYSIPTHDKNQWLLLQFMVFLMMDAKGVRNM